MRTQHGQDLERDGPRYALDALGGLAAVLGSPGWEERLPDPLRGLSEAGGSTRCALYRDEPVRGRAVLVAEWMTGSPMVPRFAEIAWSDPRFQLLDRGAGAGRVVRLDPGDGIAVEVWGCGRLAACGIGGGAGRWGILLLGRPTGSPEFDQRDIALLTAASEVFGASIRSFGTVGDEDLHSMAVESAGELIAILDPGGDLRYANPAFERITGYPVSEAAGKSIRLLESGEHPPEFYASFWGALSSGQSWTGRMINRRKDGTRYRQDTSIVPVRGDRGEIRNFVCVGRDVTQEMALEAQLRRAQKLESLGLLASGISHDFNNVMGIVMGAVERISAGGSVPAGMSRYVDLIEDAVERGQSVSRRMLAFYRDRESRVEVFDVAEVLDELADVGRHTFPRGIEIEVVRSGDRTLVKGDQSQIHQSLMNLCLNAAGAMPDGGHLTLTCRPAVPGEAEKQLEGVTGQHVCVEVRDTGTGMDADTVDKIFDPYFTTKTTGSGTGLGLPISFGIIKAQGGWVRVDSVPGSGTVFTVGFEGGGYASPERTESDERVPAPAEGETVLIVDDEAGIRLLVRETLDSEGYSVLEAGNGRAALEVYRNADVPIAALVTDLGMAEMGGAELIRQVRELDADLPVVVTTGYIDPNLADRLKGEGVVDVLIKPFRMVELLTALSRALEK